TYSNALKKNKLLGLRCAGCSTITCPPKMTCQACAKTDLSVVEMSGTGKIVTFTTTYVAPMGREVEAPYVIVMVELDEGPWIAGNLSGIDPVEADMRLIDRRVRLGHKVFPGDRYSSGEAARPLFSLLH
ncbi:MAG: Zn-ribbon domain-containing OB-fold protein, partial [Proteobacteria bacterium]|nr:Zn-ribbon domain-containing OB-fold protein [Pseudomonadota bacterium]